MWESEDGFNFGKRFEICTQMGCKRPSEERSCQGDHAHEGARLALRFKARCTAQIER
jgi:hypothetical protein